MYILCYTSKQVPLFPFCAENEKFEASEGFYVPAEELLFSSLLRISSKSTEIGMY